MLARLLVSLVVLVGVVAAVAAFVPIPAGPLAEGGNGWGGPQAVGRPFTSGLYSLTNEGRWPLEIHDVRFAGDEAPLVYLGAVVVDRPRGSFAFAVGFPPPRAAFTSAPPPLESAEGAIVPARGSRLLFVGMRAERRGDHRVPELEVTYRVRMLGKLGPLLRERIRDEVWICARRPGEDRSCDPPRDV